MLKKNRYLSLLLILFTPFCFALKVVHTEKSLYRNISIVKDDYLTCMVFETRKENPPYQTCFDEREPKKLVFNYTKLILSGLLYKPDANNILVLGLGGGTLPLTLHELLPEATITSVEIDPAVIRLARQYFNYHDNDKIKTFERDARLFVKRAALKKQSFDWIILDAFNGDYIPEHLMTQEFLQEVKSVLTDDGIITANTFSQSILYRFESATYASVFGDFYNIKRRKLGNRIILTGKQSELLPLEKIEQQAEKLDKQLRPYDVSSDWLLARFSREKDWEDDTTILTDQYSPANLLKYQGGN
ncbi:MAG: fused MFS/spermidine synthase [Gammaproteobacteria bacterium]|nr:fused MFS/spermidine synthase [Gammaproteobacteria bacterium]